MADRPYKVKNLRPRRTINLFGTILAPRAGKGHGVASLTEEQFNSTHVQSLLEMGRLGVVERPEKEEAVAAAPAPVPEPAPAPAPPAPAPAPEPEVEEPVSSEPEEEVSEEPEAPAAPDLEDTSYVWSSDELFALNSADQKTICKSRGLKQSGRESARVQRILDAQES